ESLHAQKELLVMGNLDRAAADELTDHRVAGDDVIAADLFLAQRLHGIQQALHPLIPDAGIQKAGISLKILVREQVSLRAGEERLERRQVEGESAVDDVVGQAA